MVGFAEDTHLAPGSAQEAVQNHINELGFGKFQILMLLATGGMMMSEGAEVLIMGSVTKMLGREWALSAFVKGFMTSMVYVGFALGNLFAGSLGDRFGRRPTLLLAYAVVGSFGMFTSFANNPVTMVCLRFIVGIGVGLGFPCVFSLIPEVVPMHLRGAVSSAMIGFMPLGELWASLGVLILDPDLLQPHAWRWLCRWSAFPSLLFFLFGSRYLWESPLILTRQGREEELNEMLSSVAAWNGRKPGSRIELAGVGAPDALAAEAGAQQDQAQAYSWKASASKVFSDRYRTTSLVLFMANFAKDFSYFGLNYVFPQYFQRLNRLHPSLHLSAGGEMVITSLVAFPGVALAVWATQSKLCGNITLLTSLASATGFAAVGLLSFFPEQMHLVCVILVKLLSLAYLIAVVVNMEVFPTSIRTTAIGICTCFGRAGSISAPIVFQLSVKAGGYDPFWLLIITVMWIVALGASSFLTIETKGKFLADEAPGADLSYGSASKSKLPQS